MTPLATAALVIAANAPDVDVVSYVRGPFFALSFRRGITHGWPALLVLPFAVAAAILAWDRWVRRRRSPEADPVRAGPLLALSAIGVVTHPTLDWMNTYGMRWGLPFDGGWSYGDALFIIDPWIWLTLGGALFLTSNPGRAGSLAWGGLAALATTFLLFGLPAARVPWVVGVCLIVGLRIWRRPVARTGTRRLAAAAIAMVTAYAVLLVALDGIAARHVARVAQGSLGSAVDVMVAPLPGNPFVSRVTVRTNEGYVPGRHRWFGADGGVMLFADHLIPLVSGPAEASRDEVEAVAARVGIMPDVAYYLDWSRYPYYRVQPTEGGWEVSVGDARYTAFAGAGSLGGLTVRLAR